MSPVHMERVLPSLVPNTAYVARVRSYNNLGVASEWSEALSFTTEDLHITPSGGVGNFPTFSGSGSPEGVLTTTPGKSYQDTNTGAMYLKSNGIAATGWTVIAGMAADSTMSPPTSGIYELPVGPFAGTALVGEAAIVSGQEVVLIDVGAPTLSGAAKALVALVTGLSGSNTLSEAAIGAGDASVTISALSSGATLISSTIDIQTTAPVGGVQISAPNVSLTATTNGINLTSAGYGPVSLFVYSGDPNANIVAITKGDLCIDISTPALWQASVSGTAGWIDLGSTASSATVGTYCVITNPFFLATDNICNWNPSGSPSTTPTINIGTGVQDGDTKVIRIYTAVTISSWTNCVSTTVTLPGNSTGASSTNPLTITFQYDGTNSKWRCISLV